MISSKEMKELEDKSNLSKIELMENAGKGIYEILKNKFDLKNKKVLVAAYHGNNGGDGFVAARYFSSEAMVDVLFLGEEEKLKEEGKINYQKVLENYTIQFIQLSDVDFDYYDIIIDAILGIGIEGKLREKIGNTIDGINKSKAFKVAVDVPTGLNPDTGEKSEKVINADLIVTFHDLKKGLKDYKAKTQILDIGIK